MAIIYRIGNGSPLTYTQVDDNFRYLETNLSGSVISITGSVQVTGSIVSNVDGSSLSGSFSGSFEGDGSGLTGISVGSITGVVKTGLGNTSFQTVEGDLRLTGNIIAEEYILSSSVVHVTESFASGSHIFGDSLDDTHQFTGSVLITGSINLGPENTLGNSAYSQTIGRLNHVNGNNALAQGYLNSASNASSHAEGRETKTTGVYSHAEGYQTTATNNGSHAEGSNTLASGQFSHAEGYLTTASVLGSHTEGHLTYITQDYGHAEGYQTHVVDDTSPSSYGHAEGYITIVSGSAAHAEGAHTLARGFGSHAEGSASKALGGYSHAQGVFTTALKQGSFSGGYQTLASHSYSFTHGYQLTSSATYQTTLGEFNGNISGGTKTVFQIGSGTSINKRITGISVGYSLDDTSGVNAPWFQIPSKLDNGNNIETIDLYEDAPPPTGSMFFMTGSSGVNPKLCIYDGKNWYTSSLGLHT